MRFFFTNGCIHGLSTSGSALAPPSIGACAPFERRFHQKTAPRLALLLLIAACTSQQQLPKSTQGDGSTQQPAEGVDGGNGSLAKDAMTPVCIVGALGCPCEQTGCNDGLTCSEGLCNSPNCGDGKVDQGEDCDLGSANSDNVYGGCKRNCTRGIRCGDGITNGDEMCDDANTFDDDLCSNKCVSCGSDSKAVACGSSCRSGWSCCPGEQCGASSCNANQFAPARICNGSGQCPATIAAECGGGYGCDGMVCRDSCTNDGQCAAARTCSIGKCVLKGCGNGVTEATESCDDGNSIDDDACSNGCVKCEARVGYRQCTVGGVTKCLANAVCCPSQNCSPATCAGLEFAPAQICNSKGECPTPISSTCSNDFVCEGSSCRTNCLSNGQCLKGKVCHQGNCITPACGNGLIEPGESCDNGGSNGDSGVCSLDCKTCTIRGRKECGGVCLPAGQCCADSDCPISTTAGICNQSTKTCWKPRSTVRMPLLDSGWCIGPGCSRNTNIQIKNMDGYSDRWGFLRFDWTIPSGALIERAVLTIKQQSVAGAFGSSTLRIAPCGESDARLCGGDRAVVSTASPTLCSTANSFVDCTLDMTVEARSKPMGFVLDFAPFASNVDVFYYGKGAEAAQLPTMEVTYLAP